MTRQVAPSWVTGTLTTPKSPAEVVAEIQDASRGPWLAIGTGSMLSRGNVPGIPCRPISLSAMNRILAYAHEDLTITVEAGVRLGDLNQALAQNGQWLPLHSFTESGGTVGGLIGADRRGVLAGSAGTVRDYLIGVTFVDGAGRTVRSGGQVVKNVAGYDLMKLMTGSLSELGVVVEATFKVLPRPASWGAVLMGDPSPADLERLVLDAPRTCFPTALVRGAWGEREGLLAVFAGDPVRVNSQIAVYKSLLGNDARTLGREETLGEMRTLETWLSDWTPLAWGGGLAGSLAKVPGGAFSPNPWMMDLLGGHLWASQGAPGTLNQFSLLRERIQEAGGHLHLDTPDELPAGIERWGTEPGSAITIWNGLKDALDPRSRLVHGRLPGGV